MSMENFNLEDFRTEAVARLAQWADEYDVSPRGVEELEDRRDVLAYLAEIMSKWNQADSLANMDDLLGLVNVWWGEMSSDELRDSLSNVIPPGRLKRVLGEAGSDFLQKCFGIVLDKLDPDDNDFEQNLVALAYLKGRINGIDDADSVEISQNTGKESRDHVGEAADRTEISVENPVEQIDVPAIGAGADLRYAIKKGFSRMSRAKVEGAVRFAEARSLLGYDKASLEDFYKLSAALDRLANRMGEASRQFGVDWGALRKRYYSDARILFSDFATDLVQGGELSYKLADQVRQLAGADKLLQMVLADQIDYPRFATALIDYEFDYSGSHRRYTDEGLALIRRFLTYARNLSSDEQRALVDKFCRDLLVMNQDDAYEQVEELAARLQGEEVSSPEISLGPAGEQDNTLGTDTTESGSEGFSIEEFLDGLANGAGIQAVEMELLQDEESFLDYIQRLVNAWGGRDYDAYFDKLWATIATLHTRLIEVALRQEFIRQVNGLRSDQLRKKFAELAGNGQGTADLLTYLGELAYIRHRQHRLEQSETGQGHELRVHSPGGTTGGADVISVLDHQNEDTTDPTGFDKDQVSFAVNHEDLGRYLEADLQSGTENLRAGRERLDRWLPLLVDAYEGMDSATLQTHSMASKAKALLGALNSFVGRSAEQAWDTEASREALSSIRITPVDNDQRAELQAKVDSLEVSHIDKVMTGLTVSSMERVTAEMLQTFDVFVEHVLEYKKRSAELELEYNELQKRGRMAASWAKQLLGGLEGLDLDEVRSGVDGVPTPERNRQVVQVISQYLGAKDGEALKLGDIEASLQELIEELGDHTEHAELKARLEALNPDHILAGIEALGANEISKVSDEVLEHTDVCVNQVVKRRRFDAALEKFNEVVWGDKDRAYIITHVLPKVFDVEQASGRSFENALNGKPLNVDFGALKSSEDGDGITLLETILTVNQERQEAKDDLSKIFEEVNGQYMLLKPGPQIAFSRELRNLMIEHLGYDKQSECLKNFIKDHSFSVSRHDNSQFELKAGVTSFLSALGLLLTQHSLEIPASELFEHTESTLEQGDIQNVIAQVSGAQILIDNLSVEATLNVDEEEVQGSKDKLKSYAKTYWNALLKREGAGDSAQTSQNAQHLLSEYIKENIFDQKPGGTVELNKGSLLHGLQRINAGDFDVSQFGEDMNTMCQQVWEYDNGQSVTESVGRVQKRVNSIKGRMLGLLGAPDKANIRDGLNYALHQGLFDQLLGEENRIDVSGITDVDEARGQLVKALQTKLGEINTDITIKDFFAQTGDDAQRPHELLKVLDSWKGVIDVCEVFLGYKTLGAEQGEALASIEEALESFSVEKRSGWQNLLYGKSQVVITNMLNDDFTLEQLKSLVEGQYVRIVNTFKPTEVLPPGDFNTAISAPGQYHMIPNLDTYGEIDTSTLESPVDIMSAYHGKWTSIYEEIRDNAQKIADVPKDNPLYKKYLEAKDIELHNAYYKVFNDGVSYIEQAVNSFSSYNSSQQGIIWEAVSDIKRVFDKAQRDGYRFNKSVYSTVERVREQLDADRKAQTVSQRLDSIVRGYDKLFADAKERRAAHGKGWVGKALAWSKEKGKSGALTVIEKLNALHTPLGYKGDKKLYKALLSPLTYTGIGGAGVLLGLPGIVGALSAASLAFSAASGVEWAVSSKMKLPRTPDEYRSYSAEQLVAILGKYIQREMWWSFEKTTSDLFEQEHIKQLIEKIKDRSVGSSESALVIRVQSALNQLELEVNGRANQTWLTKRKEQARQKAKQS